MILEQVFANLISLAVLLAVLGFFIKRWMDNLERKIEIVCTDLDGKLDKSDCKDFRANEQMEFVEIWNWLKYHGHSADGAVVVPKRQ